ncbi:MAG: translation elongation factor Ts [Candidatus Spechtbacterales bacterium]
MIDANQVQKLRMMTNCGMMECKKALEESGGDLANAALILRKSGAAKAVKKFERVANQGLVVSYIHAGGKVGVLLKLCCETDFVAKNDLFGQLAHDLALHIAGINPLYISGDDIPEEIRENERRIYTEQFSRSGKPIELIAKIIDGKMQTYAAEVALLEQPFVKDQDKKVKDVINEYIVKLGENIKVAGFVRYEI